MQDREHSSRRLAARSRWPLFSLLVGCLCAAEPAALAAQSLLSPARWPAGEWDKYMGLNQMFGYSRTEGTGEHGIVVGTSGAPAVHAGLKALEAGGTAADAVVTTALAQIALAGGSWVSYAGLMTGLYYDAATGKVSAFSATFDAPRGETDPMSIPTGALGAGIPSGRSALVPGFMAGAQALHDKFGKLPFAQLFEPAIYIADHGMTVDPHLAGMMAMRKPVLGRLAETRAAFLKPDGMTYTMGEQFRQPALAATLRQVATHGAAYMYTGPWAQKFVDAVQRDGGKITLQDMAGYRVRWSDPIQTTHNGYQVYSNDGVGGVATLASLNLIEAAKLADVGHPTTSAEALYKFVEIISAPSTLGARRPTTAADSAFAHYLGDVNVSGLALLNKDNARALWAKMSQPEWGELKRATSRVRAASTSEHSDAVVAIDSHGNIAAITHSANTVIWGTTGIVVDGITVPDPASFQQAKIRAAIQKEGPGARIPDEINPVIVLKDKKPVLGGSSIGSGLYEVTMQGLVNILDYKMGPQAAIDTAVFLEKMVPTTMKLIPNTAAGERQPPPAIPGLPGEVVAQAREMNGGAPLNLGGGIGFPPGYWVAAMIDPTTHKLRGGSSPQLNGIAEGH